MKRCFWENLEGTSSLFNLLMCGASSIFPGPWTPVVIEKMPGVMAEIDKTGKALRKLMAWLLELRVLVQVLHLRAVGSPAPEDWGSAGILVVARIVMPYFLEMPVPALETGSITTILVNGEWKSNQRQGSVPEVPEWAGAEASQPLAENALRNTT